MTKACIRTTGDSVGLRLIFASTGSQTFANDTIKYYLLFFLITTCVTLSKHRYSSGSTLTICLSVMPGTLWGYAICMAMLSEVRVRLGLG